MWKHVVQSVTSRSMLLPFTTGAAFMSRERRALGQTAFHTGEYFGGYNSVCNYYIYGAFDWSRYVFFCHLSYRVQISRKLVLNGFSGTLIFDAHAPNKHVRILDNTQSGRTGTTRERETQTKKNWAHMSWGTTQMTCQVRLNDDFGRRKTFIFM